MFIAASHQKNEIRKHNQKKERKFFLAKDLLLFKEIISK